VKTLEECGEMWRDRACARNGGRETRGGPWQGNNILPFARAIVDFHLDPNQFTTKSMCVIVALQANLGI